MFEWLHFQVPIGRNFTIKHAEVSLTLIKLETERWHRL